MSIMVAVDTDLAYSQWLERHIWTIPAASGGWTLAIVDVMVEISGIGIRRN